MECACEIDCDYTNKIFKIKQNLNRNTNYM